MPTLREAITKALQETSIEAQTRGRALQQMVLDGYHTDTGIKGVVLDDDAFEVTLDIVGDSIHATCECYDSRRHLCAHQTALMLKYSLAPGFFRDGLKIQHSPMPEWRRVPWSTYRLIERHDLIEALDSLRVNDMRAIGRAHGWQIKGSLKADVAASLAEAYDTPEHGQQVWDALSPNERFATALVFWGGADINLTLSANILNDLARGFGISPLDANDAMNLVESLEGKGLCRRHRHAKRVWPDKALADTVARWLPPMLDGIVPTQAKLEPSRKLDVRLGDPVICTRSVGLMLSLIAQQNLPSEIRPINSGASAAGFEPHLRSMDPAKPYRVQINTEWVPRETARYLAPIASTVQVELVTEALMHRGVIVTQDREMALDASHALALAGEPEPMQLAVLVGAFFSWSASPLFYELMRRDSSLSLWFGTGWEAGLHLMISDLRTFNGLVLRVLCSLPDQRWVEMRDIESVLRLVWPRFSATMAQRPWYRQIENWEVRATRRKGTDRWARIQGAYLRLMIAEALHWFGLADVALDARGELVAFRLQGLADLCLRRVETIEPPHPPAAADAQASAQAVRIDLPRIRVAPMRVSGQALHLLGTIGSLDRAALDTLTYTIDPAVCYEAFERGTTLEAILSQWEETMPLPMPAALREQLTRYWGRYGEVRLYEGLTVIEFADDYALAEMRAVTALDRHLIAEVSPRMVIVEAMAVPTLVTQLKAAGYAPKQEQTRR